MGFLDHSTNNIIIDAVLTDYGRKLLAENQGAFKIAFFSLGDDEVDYTTIRKYGRTVGKEKIAKNTPIFEAQTSSSNAMKHRLITLPDPLVNKMPNMSLTLGSGAEPNTSLGTDAVKLTGTTEEATLNFKQNMPGDQSVPIGLTDSSFTILVNSRFLAIGGNKANLVDTQANSKIASYTIPASSTDTKNAASVEIKVMRKQLDDTTYTQFGDYSNKNQITSILSIIGDQSGLRKDIKVTIEKMSS